MLEVRLTKSNACKLKCKHKKAAQDLRWKAGRPPRPIAGRPGRPIAGRPGYYPGAAWGAAAVGAAGAGAAYYNNGYNSCCYESYGQYVCSNQYQY